MSPSELSRLESVFASTLSEKVVDQVGLETGQSRRLRVVTPQRLFLTIVAALAGSHAESLADLQRSFNHRFGQRTAYKAFYNRLAHPGFAAFMHEMLCRLMGALALKALRPDVGSELAMFSDIIIQDGTSFAVNDSLMAAFPGRFTKNDPAAIELHATFSGFQDDVVAVTLAPDKEAERQFLPLPGELKGKLLLADRGYPSVDYFKALDDAGANFLMRLPKGFNPDVLAYYSKSGRRYPVRVGTRLAAFLADKQNQTLDLDVAYPRGKNRFEGRIIVVCRGVGDITRLACNLPRDRFSKVQVAQLYRFRWQVELCFKEWKSYANLQRFNTGNRYIVEGMIWASLCAAVLKRFLAHATQRVYGSPISTRRVAMFRDLVGALFTALTMGRRHFAAALVRAMTFVNLNAQRADIERDRQKGRLQLGLGHARPAGRPAK